MIVRIVKLTFQEEEIEKFLDLFNSFSGQILTQNGCSRLDLLRSESPKNIFFTYSIWDSEESLNLYRNSTLFKTIWPQTKILFEKDAEAWTLLQDKTFEI